MRPLTLVGVAATLMILVGAENWTLVAQEPTTVTADQVGRWMQELSNWGRWGPEPWEGSRSAAPDHTMLVFGGVPQVAVARRSGADEATARVCSATLGYDGLFGDPARRAERIDWQRNGHDEFLGEGWDGIFPERMRRIADTTAELLLPIWRRDVLHLSVTAARPEWIPREQLGVIQLEIQGGMLESRSVLRGWTTYEWTIPIEAVELGVNQVYLSVSPVSPDPEQRIVGTAFVCERST